MLDNKNQDCLIGVESTLKKESDTPRDGERCRTAGDFR